MRGAVFERLGTYGFVHHRALNEFDKLAEARRLAERHPGRSHVLEGDVCWNFAEGRNDIYFHHPDWIINSLGSEEIDRRVESGTLVRLEDLESIADDDVFLIFELKIGRGDWRQALERLIRFGQERFRDRFWVDGFSIPLLRAVRKIDPGVALSLHTECVYRGVAVIGAPEWPPLGLRRLRGLDEVEAVSIRWHGSDGFMRQACADVIDAGKVLMLSRIHDLGQFRKSRLWQARVGYVHGDFDALIACEEDIERELASGAAAAGGI